MNENIFFLLLLTISFFSIYTSFLYILSREKGYLYYLLSNIVFISTWTVSYANTFHWFPNMIYPEKIISVMVFLHTFFYVSFLARHLNLSLHFEKLNNFIRYYFLSYLLLLLLFLGTIFNLQIVFIFSVLIIPIIFRILQKSFRLYRNSVLFIIVSVSFLVLGNTITVLSELLLLPRNYFTSHAVIYGAILEVLIQTIGLGHKFYRNKELMTKVRIELIKEENIDEATSKDRKANIDEQSNFLLIANGKNKRHRIRINEILYIKSEDNYCFISLQESSILVRSTLKKMESILPQNKFIRCHRSYIVSIDKINTIKTHFLEIAEYKLPISKTYRNNIKNLDCA